MVYILGENIYGNKDKDILNSISLQKDAFNHDRGDFIQMKKGKLDLLVWIKGWQE